MDKTTENQKGIRAGLVLSLSTLFTLALLGCQSSRNYQLALSAKQEAEGTTVALASGNGGGYEGRVVYLHLDPAHPCADLSSTGQPLPEAEIDVTRVSGIQDYSLVRDQCKTLAKPISLLPVQVSPTQGSVDAFIYSGRTFNAAATPNPYAGWSRRTRLDLGKSGVSAELSGFPVLVVLNPSKVNYAEFSAGGADLRFTDAFGHPLSHEIEQWNPAGTSTIWVNVPVIHATPVPTSIVMVHGNPQAVDGQKPTGVWNSSFKGVYHLGGSLRDSTANANHLTNAGTSSGPGQSGAGATLNASIPSYLAFPQNLFWTMGNSTTLEIWFQTLGKGVLLQASDNPYGSGINRWTPPLYIEDSGKLAGGYYAGVVGAQVVTSTAAVNDGRWHQAAITLSSTSWTVYLDGSALGVTGNGVPDGFSTVQPFNYIGMGILTGWPGYALGQPDWSAGLTGQVDEVRLSGTDWSPGWVNAEYQASTDQFVGFGISEPLP